MKDTFDEVFDRLACESAGCTLENLVKDNDYYEIKEDFRKVWCVSKQDTTDIFLSLLRRLRGAMSSISNGQGEIGYAQLEDLELELLSFIPKTEGDIAFEKLNESLDQKYAGGSNGT